MPNISASIPENLKTWLDSQIEIGKYASTSDYVRDLIRSDLKRASRLDELLLEGIESGEDIHIDDGYWDKKKAVLMVQD